MTAEANEKSKGRTFTEKQVEGIIGERLARERRGNAALSKIRDMIMMLAQKGVLKSRSIPEMGEELEELISCIDITGMKEERDTDAPGNDKTEENKEHDRKAEILNFIKLFPRVNLDELLSDDEFIRFIEQRDGTLSSLYAEYIGMIGEKLNEEKAKQKRNLRSGLSSTGFSTRSSGAEDYSSLLTPTQIRIAKNAGMSCREYADYLSQLPSKSNLM